MNVSLAILYKRKLKKNFSSGAIDDETSVAILSPVQIRVVVGKKATDVCVYSELMRFFEFNESDIIGWHSDVFGFIPFPEFLAKSTEQISESDRAKVIEAIVCFLEREKMNYRILMKNGSIRAG